MKVHLGVEEGFAAAGHPARADVPLDGCDRLFVDDPFGNRIELIRAQV